MPAPVLSVVVVSWNTCDPTLACLRALHAESPRHGREIVVVDNASADGSADRVEAEFPGVRLVRNRQNTGYSRAANQGARSVSGKYLCLLNSDTEVRPGALDLLVEFLDSNPGYGAVAPKLLDADGAVQRACMRFPGVATACTYDLIWSKFPPGSWVMDSYFMRDFDHLASRDVDQPPAACLLMRRRQYLDLEGLDESMFLFFSDVDLCRRLRQSGARIRYLADSEVMHHRGASTARLPDFAVVWHRDRIAYYRKHYGAAAVPLLHSVLRLRAFEEYVRAMRSPQERARIRGIVRAVLAGTRPSAAQGAAGHPSAPERGRAVHAAADMSPPALPAAAIAPFSGRVLVIAPHPDDEVIGCGGALALHRAQGDAVQVLVLTAGTGGDPDGDHPPDRLREMREREARAGGAVLGVTDYVFWGYPDGYEVTEADLAAIADRLLEHLERTRPEIVYYPNERETHSDHYHAARATRRCFARLSFSLKALAYEVWTPCVPNWILDVSRVAAAKEEAIRRHESQLRYLDHAAKALALSSFRSIHLPRGATHGEAYVLSEEGARKPTGARRPDHSTPAEPRAAASGVRLLPASAPSGRGSASVPSADPECETPLPSGRWPALLPAGELVRGKLLVLAPHADDEVIGAGGTMALLRRAGVPVRVVHLTDGGGGDPGGRLADVAGVRRAEGRRALAALNLAPAVELGFADGSLAVQLDALCEALRREIESFSPRHLAVPSPLEVHADHRAAAEVVRRLCAQGAASGLESVLFFGVNTPVPADVLVDITAVRDVKDAALTAYESQIAYNDIRTKVRALDVSRTVNVDLPEVKACEAFVRVGVDRLAAFHAASEHLERALRAGDES